ncbi:hypothetical protein ASD8599_03956 [Ascidiaceihabitans donghaensis]|uniref:Peptidase S74 domain-containing protein n=1 Tax=Ascidiaceihabitans donghaensis TaxID=1510460 RepID=A0A2R8BPM3_9RHOB|nr:hypothetical protein [Ascidiaceihabitans donghaensis]SPH27490.1 hypothetical protein ASD8599_03956 [Ascidiaceihabitans donghaensis]
MTNYSKKLRLSTALTTGALVLMANTSFADNVIVDDLIVQGSACIGIDCNNGESFGFDTLRLKENNLRIRADDTSVSASFPSTDWQLTFNDSSNGGANKFSVEDLTASRVPFTIEGSAPTDSVYIEDGGRVGFGTNTPVVNLHVKEGNTPTLRLEQDGSSGFTPQIWDMAGNEANFFIRDATNSSKLPLRIQPNSADASIMITSNNRVGFGTTSPNAALHLRRTDGTAGFLVEEADSSVSNRTLMQLSNNGGVFFSLKDSSQASGGNWNIQNNSTELRFSNNLVSGLEMKLDTSGNLTLLGGLVTGTSGICDAGTPCDAVFDPDVYTVPTIEAHAEQMWANKHLPAVGPTLPDQPLDVTTKMLRMLNELEHAHIFIQQLNAEIGVLEARLNEMEADEG